MADNDLGPLDLEEAEKKADRVMKFGDAGITLRNEDKFLLLVDIYDKLDITKLGPFDAMAKDDEGRTLEDRINKKMKQYEDWPPLTKEALERIIGSVLPEKPIDRSRDAMPDAPEAQQPAEPAKTMAKDNDPNKLTIDGIEFTRDGSGKNDDVITMQRKSKDENGVETTQSFKLAMNKGEADTLWKELQALDTKENNTSMSTEDKRRKLDELLSVDPATDSIIYQGKTQKVAREEKIDDLIRDKGPLGKADDMRTLLPYTMEDRMRDMNRDNIVDGPYRPGQDKPDIVKGPYKPEQPASALDGLLGQVTQNAQGAMAAGLAGQRMAQGLSDADRALFDKLLADNGIAPKQLEGVKVIGSATLEQVMNMDAPKMIAGLAELSNEKREAFTPAGNTNATSQNDLPMERSNGKGGVSFP